MTSIRDSLVCLDTNEFVFGLRRNALRPECQRLLREFIPALSVVLPLQVYQELQRRMTRPEVTEAFTLLRNARSFQQDFEPADADELEQWMSRGARQGDAGIIVQCERLGVGYLVSENRDFLQEIPELPFRVLDARQGLIELGGEGDDRLEVQE